METVQQLRDHADAHLFKGEHLPALHAYSVLVQLHPNDLDARLRVADTLLAMGEVQAAAYVYTILARHAANGGYPLRALVALKILEQLEPELGQVTDQIAALYGKGSPKIGRGVRLSLVGEATALPSEIRLDTPPPKEELLPAAAKIASDLSRIDAYPETLPPIPIFSELPPEAFARMLKTLRLVRHQGGQTIIQQGDAGTAFYVLVRGKVAVQREQDGEQQRLAELSDGAIFGEMALVSAKPRSASVVTLDDCDVLEFERESLVALAGEVATLAAALDGFTRGRLLDNLLATSPLFRPLERKARLDLVKRFSAHEVPQGTHIIREGEAGKGLYLILGGAVDVWKTDGDEKVMLATLGAGDVFGEIALVLEQETTASVTAAEKSTVLFLSREVFEKLADAVDAIREYVENLGDERMMDTRLTMDAMPSDDDEGYDIDIDIDILI